jgi:hypothetical protein
MGSSENTGRKILGLITQARAEAFLLRLANRDLHVRRTPVLSEEADPAVAEKLREGYPEMAEPLRDLKLFAEALPWLQTYLRLAWNSRDQRCREWYLHEMRRHYRDATLEAGFAFGKEESKIGSDLLTAIPHAGIPREYVDDRMIAPPTVTPFEAAAFHLQSRVGDRAKYCGHVDCRERYFIADKRSQKFCSEACAGPANRESKRLWWENNRGKGAK